MKNVKKQRITEYASSTLRWLGLALLVTALLIWAANPREIIVFLAPYTGSRVMLTRMLTFSGVQSIIVGYALGRVTPKC